MVDPVRGATQQLDEFVAAVSSAADEQTAIAVAVEWARDAAGAAVAAFVRGDVVVQVEGGPVSGHDLAAADVEGVARAAIDGLGQSSIRLVPVDDGTSGRIVLAWPEGEGTGADLVLVRGMARVLGVMLRMLRLLERERAIRVESERHAAENERLLSDVRQRQVLLEQLFEIQRLITHRAPVQEVFDAITRGALTLLGDDISALRIVDESNPETYTLVSSVGIEDEALERIRRGPVGLGVGGRAITEQRLVVSEDYGRLPDALDTFVAGGLTAAMAAPVHQNGRVSGSLVVASYRPGRTYSDTERETLLAFAEHCNLALNDASAVEALRRAFGDAVHQATHDPLTGLPNRLLVLDRLTHALARARGNPQGIVVLFVDLDRFKVVNDSLGHAIGDEVLIRVAERLLATVRPADTVARLAGDEFVVVCEDLAEDFDAIRLADRIANAVSAPIPLYGRETVITASIGVARAVGGTTAEEVLRDSDVAMYRAKEKGRSRLELFDQEMRTAMLSRLETEHALRRAIQHEQFSVHFQPIVAMSSGQILCLEALVRWDDPDVGTRLPAEFIPVAEETGLIVPLGRWVLLEACSQMAAWRRAFPHLDQVQMAVNLSARQFGDPHLVTNLADAVGETGLPPSGLTLEITESVLMEEAESTVDTLRALKQLGFQLSIDDFGTGYSSLSYLKRFPVDTLKIDRSFVDGLGSDPEDDAIVTAVIRLAHVLGLSVVAEGVETAVQLGRLRDLGCNGVQGYLLGRPIPGPDTTVLLSRGNNLLPV